MSIVIPAHLALDATRALALSAQPDAPVEPDRVRTRPRAFGFLRALRRRASAATPAERGDAAAPG
ncbi:hypothetical protein, partial [Actinophytocola sp.]|uniref:hypothetical protein n=1 Tax=Actinophytocola sp. TaxID=1872138 RepID=UPI003D6BC4DB